MDNEKKRDRILAYAVAGMYFLFLCWLVLFKLADSVDKIPSMRGINLIPFHYDELAGTRFHLTEVAYNVLAFIPAGFYLSAFGKKKVLSGIGLSALLSLGFEVIQWIFALGASDVTDLITNTAGGVIGVCLYFALGRLFRGKQVRIVSIIGAVLIAAFAGLMTVLSIANP